MDKEVNHEENEVPDEPEVSPQEERGDDVEAEQGEQAPTQTVDRAYNYRPVTEALRDVAYILDHLRTLGPLKMGIFLTNEVTAEDRGVVHFYPTREQAGALVQAVNRAANTRLTWEEDLLSAPALTLPFGKYLELSMEVRG